MNASGGSSQDGAVATNTRILSVQFEGSGHGTLATHSGEECVDDCILKISTTNETALTVQADVYSRLSEVSLPGCGNKCTLPASPDDISVRVSFDSNHNLVFVTNNRYTADVAFKSPEEADRLCSDEAAERGFLGEQWRAWLSTGMRDTSGAIVAQVTAKDRLRGARGWVQPDGLRIADAPDELTEVGPKHRIAEVARDTTLEDDQVFTGTKVSGDALTPNGLCGIFPAVLGRYSGDRVQWTESASGCTGRLYCFGIDSIRPLPEPKSFVRHQAFVTKAKFSPRSGGLMEADALCRHEARTVQVICQAGAGEALCPYKALLATATQGPFERFKYRGPWARTDGTLWLRRATEFPVSPLQPVVVDPAEYSAPGIVGVWTGMKRGRLSACDWSNPSAVEEGGIGYANFSGPSALAASHSFGCDVALSIYCLIDI